MAMNGHRLCGLESTMIAWLLFTDYVSAVEHCTAFCQFRFNWRLFGEQFDHVG